jgi:hypothetical protein
VGIVELAAELAAAVDGVDWPADRVQAAWSGLLTATHESSRAELDDALEVLCRRIERWQPADADGTAFAALPAGTLVEHGASARRLGQVLLTKLPEVLHGARRYADRCLADPATPAADADEEPTDVEMEVDGRPIPQSVFRSGLAEDRAGGCCLVYLEQWTMPAIAALSRDRELLKSAVADPDLVAAAAAMEQSDAHWLPVLLSTQLDARWLVLCPTVGRGFRVVMDGICDNFTLHALLAGALVPLGVPGGRDGRPGDINPPELLAYLRGEADDCPREWVGGVWNLYDYRAAGQDLSRPGGAAAAWVWGEGRPTDVPPVDGVRTLLVGPPAYDRTWSPVRIFEALRPRVDVVEELPATEVRAMLDHLADLGSREPDPA